MNLCRSEVVRVRDVVERYMDLAVGLEEHCDRCLATERWGGSVVLMVLDAAFTSVGLNYFNIVVPRVMAFESRFVKTGVVTDLSELAVMEHSNVRDIWKNERSWNVAVEVARILDRVGGSYGLDGRLALRRWAGESELVGWLA